MAGFSGCGLVATCRLSYKFSPVTRLFFRAFPGNLFSITSIVHRNYHNGLKTTLLLGGMWALLVCIGALVARGTGQAMWILLFAGIGLAQTAYSYWNSASLALRSMNAYPVS